MVVYRVPLDSSLYDWCEKESKKLGIDVHKFVNDIIRYKIGKPTMWVDFDSYKKK